MSCSILALTDDNGTKTSITQVLRSISPDLSVKHFKNQQDLIKELKKSINLSLVLVDFTEDIVSLTSLMSVIKEKSKSNPIKSIVMLQNENANDLIISKYLSIGFSGFLLKPFCQKSVIEVLRVSDSLSRKGSIARLKIATSINVKNFLDKQNRVIEGSSILKAVKNACSIFESENEDFSVENAAKELVALPTKERVEKKSLDLFKIFSRNSRKRLEEA